jgi:LmbE family N-acetylglucosaminyl deacetylase
MVVLAHPDDETFCSGLIALLADKGCDVHLIYVTSGENGADVSGQGLSGSALGRVREDEMSHAARILGVKRHAVFLRYKNDNVGKFRYRLADQVHDLLEDIKPGLVVTFDQGGITGHTDHIVVGEVVTRVIDNSAVNTTLARMTMSHSRVDMLNHILKGAGSVYTLEPGVSAGSVDVAVDVSAYAHQRKAVLEAHQTQFRTVDKTAWSSFVDNDHHEEFVIEKTGRDVDLLKALLGIE